MSVLINKDTKIITQGMAQLRDNDDGTISAFHYGAP